MAEKACHDLSSTTLRGLTQALGRMSDYLPISEEEAWHTAYRVFLSTLEALACPAEEQCRFMGDYNTAWELRDEALAGRYLIGSDLLTEHQESAMQAFFAAIDPIPVNDMPGGAGRAPNLAAMQNPAWEPIRSLSKNLLVTLAPVTDINQAFLDALANAP